mmetsp:Transcript_34863/g.93170  ORF Transcript_34863/g.93170 Transcript_34863/m.93170 type:complete len:221 (-) Transcript_34863:460-1122(-)
MNHDHCCCSSLEEHVGVPSRFNKGTFGHCPGIIRAADRIDGFGGSKPTPPSRFSSRARRESPITQGSENRAQAESRRPRGAYFCARLAMSRAWARLSLVRTAKSFGWLHPERTEVRAAKSPPDHDAGEPLPLGKRSRERRPCRVPEARVEYVPAWRFGARPRGGETTKSCAPTCRRGPRTTAAACCKRYGGTRCRGTHLNLVDSCRLLSIMPARNTIRGV